MGAPLAYYLSWRTYGTWVHGDERGSVDLWNNRVDQPYLAHDPEREARVQGLMTQPMFVMTSPQRGVVDRAIRDHCEIRGWENRALNVRTNHVHIVVDCHETHAPEQAMEQFKYWGTRRLREGGFVAVDRQVWADRGSTRWINNLAKLDEAIHYVLHCQ